MARPKIDPDAPSAPKTYQEALEQGMLDVSDVPADRPDDPTVAQKIEFATKVLGEKATVLGKIGTVRNLLHALIETESGSQDQAAWVRFHLPRKIRTKSGTEVDADEVESA
jgi:hypothetical protein